MKHLYSKFLFFAISVCFVYNSFGDSRKLDVVSTNNYLTISDCPSGPITANVNAGTCDAVVNFTIPTTDIPGGNMVLITAYGNGDVFPLGSTIVTYEERDILNAPSGNSCTFTVNVIDNESPTLTSVADRNENLDASCGFTIPDYTTLTTANDNCAALTVTQSPVAGTVISGAGTMQIITLSTNDGSNPVVSTTFDVTLNDNIAPTLTTVADRNENLDASCDFTIPDYTTLTTANDNCVTLTVTQVPIAGTVISGAGTVQTITLSTNDGSNPVVSTTFDVTLIDNISPSLTAVADRNENLDTSCDFTIPDYTTLTTANDNCGTLTVTQSPVAGTVISGAGTVQTITLSTNDGSNPVVSTTFDVT
ncbi:HYR domain-containing protein, partial [uncultured Winogradskyella sp.]